LPYVAVYPYCGTLMFVSTVWQREMLFECFCLCFKKVVELLFLQVKYLGGRSPAFGSLSCFSLCNFGPAFSTPSGPSQNRRPVTGLVTCVFLNPKRHNVGANTSTNAILGGDVSADATCGPVGEIN